MIRKKFGCFFAWLFAQCLCPSLSKYIRGEKNIWPPIAHNCGRLSIKSWHCIALRPQKWQSIFAVLLPMVLNDSGQCHPLMTGGRVVKRTTSWCFANGQETGTIGVPAVPLLPLFLLILLLLLLVYRPSCANSIRRHCCWLVLLLIYCLLATRAPQVVQIAGLNRFLFERSSLNQIDEESVCFFEIPLTTSSVICAIPSCSLRFLGLIGHPLETLYFFDLKTQI